MKRLFVIVPMIVAVIVLMVMCVRNSSVRSARGDDYYAGLDMDIFSYDISCDEIKGVIRNFENAVYDIDGEPIELDSAAMLKVMSDNGVSFDRLIKESSLRVINTTDFQPLSRHYFVYIQPPTYREDWAFNLFIMLEYKGAENSDLNEAYYRLLSRELSGEPGGGKVEFNGEEFGNGAEFIERFGVEWKATYRVLDFVEMN